MSPIALIHASSATAACLLGAWQLIALRRGLRHLGFDWLAGLSPIHGLSVFTLVSLVLALVFARRRDFANHRRWVTGAYVGLCAAGVFAVAVPGRDLNVLLFTQLPALLASSL